MKIRRDVISVNLW